jgi:diguanylate cyclase
VNGLPNSGSLSAPESPASDAILAKFRDITSALLEAIRNFTEGSEGKNSAAFKAELDQYLPRLKETSDVQELSEIEESLKKLIFCQREEERTYHQNQYFEFSKIVETLLAGINDFTSDNSEFNNRLGVNLSQIGRAAESANLKEIRYRIHQMVSNAKQVLEEKQEHNSEKQRELLQRVEALESQLSKAEEEILTDGLTEVYNRRAFDKRIREEVKRNQAREPDLGLLLFDIDHFKNVNDTHGHPIGDRVLVALAKHARTVFRIDDFIARYGGEEFSVLLRAPSIEIVWEVAERLRVSIAQREFRYQENSGGSKTLQITISGGVAWFRDGDTHESLILRADQCLYLAKQNGRNQIRQEVDLDKVNLEDMPPLSHP